MEVHWSSVVVVDGFGVESAFYIDKFFNYLFNRKNNSMSVGELMNDCLGGGASPSEVSTPPSEIILGWLRLAQRIRIEIRHNGRMMA